VDQRVQANLPTPGKVETAKAGCGHENGNQEGRIRGPPQLKLTEEFFVSDAKLPSRNGGDLGEKKCAMISRRNFLSLLAPLPLLPAVGPHMLLWEKPTRLGWTPASADVDFDVLKQSI
jgi:hypothetical protein